MSLSWEEAVPIAYATLQTVAVLSSSVYILCKSSGSLSKKLSLIWKTKWIYYSVLATLYDQATDIAVVLYWYDLSIKDKKDNDYVEHMDMVLMFWLGLSILIAARVVACVVLFDTGRGIFNSILGLFDLFVVRQVWEAVTNNEIEPTEDMRRAQMGEVIIESIPQIILQSVFLIRTINNENSENNELNTIIIVVSLFFSVISCSNKYIAVDGKLGDFPGMFDASIEKLECQCCKSKVKQNINYPMVNYGYLARVIWRILNVISRLTLYGLLWSVVGGIFLAIFTTMFVFSYVMLSGLDIYQDFDFWDSFSMAPLFHLLSPIWEEKNYDNDAIVAVIHQLIENICALIVILIFALKTDFDCGVCANSHVRGIYKNEAVLVYVLLYIISVVLSSGLFFLIPTIQKYVESYHSNQPQQP